MLIMIILLLFLFLVCFYCWRFYPQQIMPIGEVIKISTPEYEKYRDDCLHPCVRETENGDYVMVQSPYYGWNNMVENPLFYRSNNLKDFGQGLLLDDTPETGFNSDPNVFAEGDSVYCFWRTCHTPQCKKNGMEEMVIGGAICEGKVSPKHLYIYNNWEKGDVTQCPILMKYDGKYRFYAVWYQYEPERKNKGVAVWEGTSLGNPDFNLVGTFEFDNPLVCDKLFQKKMGKKIWYFPRPKRYDLWHFDLFEYDGKLFMVSCAEKDDNIMLSVSTDWKHFKTIRKPLVNNHYSEVFIGYRQYYYKPTAVVKNGLLYLYYTANAQDDPCRNHLFLSVKPICDLNY